jgi:SAM-dependent methyltransferase
MVIDHDNLGEFRDPANYDLEEGQGNEPRITFYGSLIREFGEPALEVACGTGLVTIPLAQQGLEMAGVDLTPEMLAYARHKAAALGLSLSWTEADARNFELGRQFRFIYITGNAFQAFLTREDQEALLARVRAHLADGGAFAFETRNPRWPDLVTQAEEEQWGAYTSIEGRTVSITGTYYYEAVSQIKHWTTYRRWEEDGQERRKTSQIATRYTFPQELEALLHYNGFRLIRRYGDWEMNPLQAESPSIISVCQKR